MSIRAEVLSQQALALAAVGDGQAAAVRILLSRARGDREALVLARDRLLGRLDHHPNDALTSCALDFVSRALERITPDTGRGD